MHDSITMADVGSIVNVSGSRIATPFGPPSPGRTPTKMPSSRPTSISARIFHVSRTEKPCIRSVIASIYFPNMASIGPFGMITSNATSKVTNIASEKTRAVTMHFHHAMRPMIAHEARDEQEARDVQSQPLHERAEEPRRHEDLQDAAELVAGDEGARHGSRA